MNSKKYIKLVLFPILLFTIGILFSCKQKPDNRIQLFGATGSMLTANEICDSFTNNYSIKIESNFAASGHLARQIKAGAEADIYISANKQWIDYLDENELIIKDSISSLASNKLVLICLKSKKVNIEFTRDFDIQSSIPDKISIGDPKYVPAGSYAKQVLDSLDWYKKIQSQIILAKDVRSVLNYVELGECDWGIVYYSEAIKSEKVKIAYEIPQNLYDPITFYFALLSENKESKELYQYFKSKISKKILNKHGFIKMN